jgi:hypothetical protein
MVGKLFGHLRRNAVAYAALFIALGGSSYAVTRFTGNRVGPLPAVAAFSSQPGQPLGDGQHAAIHLTREDFDVGDMHRPGRHDSRLVAHQAGIYTVDGDASFLAGQPGCGGPPRVAWIHLQRASGGGADYGRTTFGTNCRAPTLIHTGAIVRMRTGDYLELRVMQREGKDVKVAGRLAAAYVSG